MGLKSWWKKVLPVTPDLPRHIRGVRQGNSTGHYESQPGHMEDGRSTAERSTGLRPGPHNPTHPNAPNLSPP